MERPFAQMWSRMLKKLVWVTSRHGSPTWKGDFHPNLCRKNASDLSGPRKCNQEFHFAVLDTLMKNARWVCPWHAVEKRGSLPELRQACPKNLRGPDSDTDLLSGWVNLTQDRVIKVQRTDVLPTNAIMGSISLRGHYCRKRASGMRWGSGFETSPPHPFFPSFWTTICLQIGQSHVVELIQTAMMHEACGGNKGGDMSQRNATCRMGGVTRMRHFRSFLTKKRTYRGQMRVEAEIIMKEILSRFGECRSDKACGLSFWS